MKRTTSIMILCVFGVLSICHLAIAYKADHLQRLFDYNTSVPLNVEEHYEKTTRGFDVHHLSYSSMRGVRIPGRFFSPNFGGSSNCRPVIFWVHGFMTSKDEFEALSLVLFPYLQDQNLPYAVMAIDLPYHGERFEFGNSIFPMNFIQARNNFYQAIVDVRRGFDYLETRNDVDMSQLHMVGVSMGSIITTLVCSCDPRPAAVGLIVGGGNLCRIFGETSLGPLQNSNNLTNFHSEILDMLLHSLDPIHIAHLTQGKAFQLHNGIQDDTVPTGQELFDALPQPKGQYWYDGTHITTFLYIDQIFERMMDWFEMY